MLWPTRTSASSWRRRASRFMSSERSLAWALSMQPPLRRPISLAFAAATAASKPVRL